MKSATSFDIVNVPNNLPAGTVAFQFTTSNAAGLWDFVFKWLNGMWSGWATLPVTGEVRPFGCVPGVVNWARFLDWGTIWISPLAELGLADLTSTGTSLVLIGWANCPPGWVP